MNIIITTDGKSVGEDHDVKRLKTNWLEDLEGLFSIVTNEMSGNVNGCQLNVETFIQLIFLCLFFLFQ